MEFIAKSALQIINLKVFPIMNYYNVFLQFAAVLFSVNLGCAITHT
jgi:hypothetical protein